MAITGDVSDLDEMLWNGEPYLPQRDSYSVELPSGVVGTSFGGGLDKLQLQFVNAPYYVSVTYTAYDGFQAAYLEYFLKKNRGQKFVAWLLISGVEPEQFVVQYTEDNPQISKTGYTASVTITLQVEPSVDRDFEDFIFTFGQQAGNPKEWFDIANIGVKLWP